MSEEQDKQLQEDADAGMDTFFAAPAQKADAPQKTGGMSKNVKALIAGGAVLVLLGGALTAVLLMNKDGGGLTEEEESSLVSSLSEEEKLALVLNPGLMEDVVQVDVDGTEPFTVTRTAPADDTGKPTYSLKGYEQFALNNDMLYTLANNGSGMTAEREVDLEPEDLAKYGLADPAAEVTLTYEDGTVYSFAIGDPSPSDTSRTYVLSDGKVYLVRSAPMTNYQLAPVRFLSTTVLAEPDDESYPIVNSVRIERSDLDYDIMLEYAAEDVDDDIGTAAAHVMTEPVNAYLTLDKSVGVTNGMFGLNASEIVAVSPDAAALRDAGLDDPQCTVTMDCDDGNTYVLHFGGSYTNDSGRYYYAQLEGTDLLYGISTEKAVWATMKPDDIVSQNIIAVLVWKVGTLDVSVDGAQIRFVGEGEDKNTYEVTKDGTPCDNERYRTFYRFLLGIYGEELCIGETLPAGEPDAEVHLTTQDGLTDQTVTFYRLSNMKTLVAVNGRPTYLIRSSCLDTMRHNIEIFDTEEEFSLTWQ